MAKGIGEKAIGKWASAHANSLVTEALVGQARGEVVANMKAFRFELTPELENLVKQTSSASSRGFGSSAAKAADQLVMHKVAQNVAKHFPEIKRAVIVQNLGGYSKIFPTVAQEIVQAAGQGALRGVVSTNFHMASKSFRARGVLFGRDLEADGLNIIGLSWKLQGDEEISISVENAGAVRDLGVFDAGILNQGLRYAADQRVVAITITPGYGRIIARVTYLHPVLTDTPLGLPHY